MIENINGLRIVEDINMTKTVTKSEPKTIKERFFSIPWKPWEKNKTVYFQVPSEEVFILQGAMVMHPVTAQRLRIETERKGKQNLTALWNDYNILKNIRNIA